jgi:hypothetical protein
MFKKSVEKKVMKNFHKQVKKIKKKLDEAIKSNNNTKLKKECENLLALTDNLIKLHEENNLRLNDSQLLDIKQKKKDVLNFLDNLKQYENINLETLQKNKKEENKK